LAPGKPLELYNLKDDIGETKNVAEAYPDVVAKIEAHMKAARTESTDWPVQMAVPGEDGSAQAKSDKDDAIAVVGKPAKPGQGMQMVVGVSFVAVLGIGIWAATTRRKAKGLAFVCLG
jgi:hypothetical protein